MKRIEIYEREYESENERDGDGRPTGNKLPDSRDDIFSFLNDECLLTKYEESKDLFKKKKIEFLWYEWGLFKIALTTNYLPRGKNYEKRIQIEAMPFDATLPKKLEDKLKQEGFEKIQN